MKKPLIVIAALAACGLGSAQAQDSPWMLRARAVHLDMANQDSTGLGLSVDNKTFAAVDISYFFNKNMAAELMLTSPQRQTVHSVAVGDSDLGTFKHLPPTLMFQYHFTDLQGFKPYVGVGINYTRISHVNLAAGASPVTLDDHSWGGALQMGLDIPLDRNWSLNFDLKKIYIRSDVYVNAVNNGQLRLDPLAASVGVGYRF